MVVLELNAVLSPEIFCLRTFIHPLSLPYLSVKQSDEFAAMFIAVVPHAAPGSLQAPSAQGKVAELRQELNSGGKKDKNHSAKKIALKKIVANMTMSNNDMVALFPDVIGCMTIPSLEIKKM
jgi:hypothetical protein